jgi:hypothetical protein
MQKRGGFIIMLKLPPLPPLPTAVEIRAYHGSSDRLIGIHQARADLTNAIYKQRSEIIVQYVRECRNFDELKVGILAWMEKSK